MEAFQIIASGIRKNGLNLNGSAGIARTPENCDGEFEARDLHEIDRHVSSVCASISRFSQLVSPKAVADEGVDVFYTSVKNWSQGSLEEIEHILNLMEYVEDTALGCSSLSITERQAVKDMVDLGELCQSLKKQVGEFLSGVDLELRTSHFWKFWNTKIVPAQKSLSIEVRKYRIAIAGL